MVKQPRVERHRVKRQTVKNATRVKMKKKNILCIILGLGELRQFLGRALRLGQARGIALLLVDQINLKHTKKMYYFRVRLG